MIGKPSSRTVTPRMRAIGATGLAIYNEGPSTVCFGGFNVHVSNTFARFLANYTDRLDYT